MRKVQCTEYKVIDGRRVASGNIAGTFHCWGAEYEEFENGPGNYTVAIVEIHDGSIRTFMPTDIIFYE